MDSSFNNDRPLPAPETPDTPAEPLSPAVQRFQSCRWRQPADEANPEHCGHRDVLPMTGTTGFNAESWCPDCPHYKAKRTPRKREPARDDYWRR
ncbi:MAG: hypothetical protein AB7O67_04025 [Vicinamibacterales bacterium]